MIDMKDLCAGTRPIIKEKILITSADSFDGYEIMEYKGMVWGLSIRARDFGSDWLMGCKNCTGGELEAYSSLGDEARQISVDRMLQSAKRMKANGIINFRFEHSHSYGGVGQVAAWGTAVSIEPVKNYIPTGAIGNILYEMAAGGASFAASAKPSTKSSSTSPISNEVVRQSISSASSSNFRDYPLAEFRVHGNQLVVHCPFCHKEDNITEVIGNEMYDYDLSKENGQQHKCKKCSGIYTLPNIKVE